jgi:hypothetical protein
MTKKKTEQINLPCSVHTDSRTGHHVVHGGRGMIERSATDHAIRKARRALHPEHRIVLIERRRGRNYSSPIRTMLRRLRPVHGVLWAAVSVGPERSLNPAPQKNHGNPKRENGILAKLASDTNYLQ